MSRQFVEIPSAASEEDQSHPTRPASSDSGDGRVLPIDRRTYPREETLESVMSTALRAEDKELHKILCALEDLGKLVKSRNFEHADVDEALKEAAVWAIQKSVLDREVRSLAITDDLTGFFNRRGFLAAATQQLRLAHRDRRSVVLLFCDVDQLKHINDSFGHQEGDLALIHAADALEETFRDSDVLARLSGDEFAVLAWEASIPDVQAILSRMQRNLAKANAGEERYSLSLSVGVARYDPQSPLPLGDLMANADRDMYRHKSRRAYAARCR